ncbi:MAG: ribonuclease H-like domain-containing protein [Holosporales bacterium]|jgi:ribonuclease D|nr:ribonuclease H-like domain-containing protein [Holosporales bacterium]
MQLNLSSFDIPEGVDFGSSVAIDTETMGLYPHRDRLCLVQLSSGDGTCFLVHFPEPAFDQAHRLKKLLGDDSVQKIFHYGRFDLAVLMKSFKLHITNVYCTKIASKLVRTYTDKHSLKSLCKELLGIDIDKAQQSSDWGGEILSPEQLEYAGSDVLFLHNLKEKLDALLLREGRAELAQACFDFLPYRALLDTMASEEWDIFSH